jgi:SAM-dependent methyltransferase
MGIRSTVFGRLRDSLPYPARQWVKRQRWFLPVSRRVLGHAVYCESYYRDVERLEGESVHHVAGWIAKDLRPRRLIDIGCGSGLLMRELSDRGIDVFGVEVSQDAIQLVTRGKGLPAVRFDLTLPGRDLPGIPYDVAVSCEVAEHLEARHAGRFVEHLASAAPVVYMTAAEPDREAGVGLYHLNEQPHAYWVALMQERGFRVDDLTTERARQYLYDHRVLWHLRRLLVFRREET